MAKNITINVIQKLKKAIAENNKLDISRILNEYNIFSKDVSGTSIIDVLLRLKENSKSLIEEAFMLNPSLAANKKGLNDALEHVIFCNKKHDPELINFFVEKGADVDI